MPVVVSYDQGMREGYAARSAQAFQQQNEGDALFQRGQALTMQQNAQRTAEADRHREMNDTEYFRQADLDQRGQEFDREQTLREREQGFREGELDNTQANQTVAGEDGSEFQATPAQAVAVGNLKATGATGDDFNEGLRRVLGLPEPMVDYQTQEGETIKVPRSQLPALQQKDAAIQAQRDKTQAADEFKQQQFEQRRSVQDERLQQGWAGIDLRRMALNPATKEQAQALAAAKAQNANDLADAQAHLKAARNAMDTYRKAKPGGFVDQDNDPKWAAMKADVEGAQKVLFDQYDKAREVLQNAIGLNAQAQLGGPANAPGRNTPSGTPTGGANAPQAGGTAAAKPKYSATATGPDGRKSGYNPITKAWELIQP